jgi:hypothetical protein
VVTLVTIEEEIKMPKLGNVPFGKSHSASEFFVFPAIATAPKQGDLLQLAEVASHVETIP